MIRMLLLCLALTGCAAPATGGDPYLHSEEPALAQFCAAHPHHGTCP
jgi:hypothetical protein